MSYDKQMLKRSIIALQSFSPISVPVADSALSMQHSIPLCFLIGGFPVTAERSFRRPCFRANKESPASLVLALPISHIMMILIIPMHPTKFTSNLTFFFPLPLLLLFPWQPRASTATWNHDKHKSQKMDLTDLASPHRTHIEADSNA